MGVSSAVLPGLERKPGVQNWIEKLPAPMRAAWHRSAIYRSAKHIAASPRGEALGVGYAIASAKNWAQHICDTGDVKQFPGLQHVKPPSRAEACAAIALWESMRAAAKADMSIPARDRRVLELAFERIDRESEVIDLAFTESLHPRVDKGKSGGGRFTTKDSGASTNYVRAKTKGPLARAIRRRLPQKPGQSFEQAVRDFQRRHGLRVDGVVGRQTTAALLGDKNASGVKVGTIRDHQASRLLNKGKGKRRAQLAKRRLTNLVRRAIVADHLLEFTPSTAERKKAAAKGQAMPSDNGGGRFPIRNRAELQKAIRAVGRARPNTEEERRKVRRFIRRRAQALNAMDLLPDNWQADGSLKS